MPTGDVDALPELFSYGDAREAGLSHRRIYALRDSGLIQPLARGTYLRADAALDADPLLVHMALRAPHATICLASALARHDLTDDIPAATDIAIPRGRRRPSTPAPIAWHAFAADTFDLGRETLRLTDTAAIGLYSPERSIVDAFRLRYSEGSELAYEALRRWIRMSGNHPADLIRMAEHFPKALPSLRAALAALL